MSLKFRRAFEYVWENEGGFVDNESDPGGATNYGISIRFLQSLEDEKLRRYGIFKDINGLTSKTIQDLTIDQARNIYKNEFWDLARYEDIWHDNIAYYIFDCCVNHGQKRGIKLLQRATWGYDPKYRSIILDDGILGDKTIKVVEEISEDLIDGTSASFLSVIRAERAGYYRLLAHLQKDGKKNLEGWLNRCYKKVWE
jgi:lysozyme family protein